ncbi:hypothetical protein MMC22_007695 [Lobaria immixta]|nr:hypothetical protein [Lobaria immixta]
MEPLQKFLVDSHAKSNQPSVDHCAARLHDLEVRLNHNRVREPNEQEARMEEGFRKDANTFLANRDPKIAEATAKTEEESRRSQEAREIRELVEFVDGRLEAWEE